MPFKTLTCLAHRGGCGHAPENTLSAVETAIGMGADWIEIDVHRVDRALVVIHDDTLERTTNGVGPVAGKPLDYLRRLDAGRGERIPLLVEVLDRIKSPVGINIELKGPHTAEPVVDALDSRIGQGKLTPDQILVSSFDPRQLGTVRQLAPQLNLGVLFSNRRDFDPDLARRLNALSVHLSRKLASRRVVTDLHGFGFRVFVYTVNDVSEMINLRRMGVDGVFTDYPDRVISLNQCCETKHLQTNGKG